MQQRLPRSISFGCREKDDKNRSYFSKFYIDVFIKAAHAGSRNLGLTTASLWRGRWGLSCIPSYYKKRDVSVIVITVPGQW